MASTSPNIQAGGTVFEFKEPQKSDYIKCQTEEHDAENCNVVHRLVHLLNFHHQNPKVGLYEYIDSLNNYDISTFFEDWHQIKKHHLYQQEDIEWIQKAINCHCDGNEKCEFVTRHQRDREKEEFSECEDLKNLILRDHIDSIHSFLFHSISQRRKFVPYGDIEDENEETYDDIFGNEPQSIDQCNPQQIIYILKHRIFDNLKPKFKEKIANHKQDIFDYLKQNAFDGKKLSEIKKAQFGKGLAQHMNNKKLTSSFCALYKNLMECELPLVEKDEQKKAGQIIISSKSKFITETVSSNAADEKESKEQFYSFGEKFLYNPKHKRSKMYVHAKYSSLKEELFEYLVRTNKEDDAAKLLEKQLEIIDLMDEKFRPLLTELVRAGPITNADVLWVDDDESDYKDDSIKMVCIESKSCKQLNEIISKLCKHIKYDHIETNFSLLRSLKMKLTSVRSKLNKLNGKEQIHQTLMQELSPLFHQIAEKWEGSAHVETQSNNLECNFSESLRNEFVSYAIEQFKEALKINKEKFIAEQQKNRINLLIDKCEIKMKMESIKKMRASRNKSNSDYGIKKDDQISADHVLALMLYCQCTTLCTLFR